MLDPLTERNMPFWGWFWLDVFWPIQAAFVVGEPLCDVGTPSWALISFWWWFLLGVVLVNSGHFLGGWATLCCRNTLLSPTDFTQDHSRQIRTFGYQRNTYGNRAECVFWGILARRFWSIQAIFVVGEAFCDVRTFSWALITSWRIIQWK